MQQESGKNLKKTCGIVADLVFFLLIDLETLW